MLINTILLPASGKTIISTPLGGQKSVLTIKLATENYQAEKI